MQIAIDDFGTGYSSLSYLQRVPFDILKIDRAFVAALRHEDPQTTLVRTIMDLGRTLGRTAIAEGIEEQVELDGLLALGCELGQGMHFGGALDAATLERDLDLMPADPGRIGVLAGEPAELFARRAARSAAGQRHFGARWNCACDGGSSSGSGSASSMRASAWARSASV